MLNVTVHTSSTRRPGLADAVRHVAHWVAFARAALTVARERRRLLQLDDRMLKDIGIGRSEAYHEAAKSFGDIPRYRPHLF